MSLVLRIRPPENYPLPPPSSSVVPLENFFEQEWVCHPDSRAELLFIRRENGDKERKESVGGNNGNGPPAHVAFPGGRTEENDEGALYTGELTDVNCVV